MKQTRTVSLLKVVLRIDTHPEPRGSVIDSVAPRKGWNWVGKTPTSDEGMGDDKGSPG